MSENDEWKIAYVIPGFVQHWLESWKKVFYTGLCYSFFTLFVGDNLNSFSPVLNISKSLWKSGRWVAGGVGGH